MYITCVCARMCVCACFQEFLMVMVVAVVGGRGGSIFAEGLIDQEARTLRRYYGNAFEQ